jgi:UDP-N-acetylglucosamine--N-acetylmuramyl-(pentapeptide) pyrophosphoryl-undecaprenol N-acetylglucosamine transferase
MKPLRVLAVSGDSVGHLSHAVVVLGALARRYDLDAAVALPADSRFREWVERRGDAVHAVGSVGGTHRELSRADLARHAGTLAGATLRGAREGAALLERFRPDLVLGTGGRCSFAPMAAAALRGYPTLTVPHYALRRANRALAWMVDRTCLARAADVARFPRFLRPRLRVTRTPLRPEAFAPACARAARERLGLDPDRPVVALIGYSAGSPGTTRLFADAARRLRAERPDAQLVVQYGNHPPAGGDAEALGAGVLARPFFDDLLSVFPACDLVVSAAGETTLLEVCARGVPAVCVSVADSPIGPHIRDLADDLVQAGAALFLPPERLSGAAVAGEAARLLADGARRERMAAAARAAADPGAVEAIVEVVEELLLERGTLPRPLEPALA